MIRRRIARIGFGAYQNNHPTYLLALAVIERTILDCLGGQCIKMEDVRSARQAITEHPTDTEFSFFWWLQMVFDEPEQIHAAIKRAYENGRLSRIIGGAEERYSRARTYEKDPCKKIPARQEKNRVYHAN
jgi:hypothetical protein